MNIDEQLIVDQAAYWNLRFTSERVSDAEKTAFQAWLDADKRHQFEFVMQHGVLRQALQLLETAFSERPPSQPLKSFWIAATRKMLREREAIGDDLEWMSRTIVCEEAAGYPIGSSGKCRS